MHAANSCNHNCIDITSASNAREELDELLQVNLSIAFACRLYFYRLDWHCNYLESNLLSSINRTNENTAKGKMRGHHRSQEVARNETKGYEPEP